MAPLTPSAGARLLLHRLLSTAAEVAAEASPVANNAKKASHPVAKEVASEVAHSIAKDAKKAARPVSKKMASEAGQAAHPVAEDAKKAATKDSRPLYRRLSALGNAGEASWVLEGREALSVDLEWYVKELRNYKRHAQAMELMDWMVPQVQKLLGFITGVLNSSCFILMFVLLLLVFNYVYSTYARICLGFWQLMDWMVPQVQKLLGFITGVLNSSCFILMFVLLLLVFNYVYSTYARICLGLWQLMDWMVRSKGMNMSYTNHATHLALTYKVRGIEAVEKYFDGLHDPARNHRTYGALLNCYCSSKKEEKATDIYRKMDELGISSSTLPINNLMSFYMKLGQHKKVASLFQEMKAKNIKLDNLTCCVLMTSYAAMKKIDAVEEVLKEMEEKDVVLGWSAYSTLASIYVSAGLVEKAESALKKLEGLVQACDGRQPFDFLMNLYASIGNLSEVNRVWDMVKATFPKVTNTSYLGMLQAPYKLNDADRMKQIFEECVSNHESYGAKLTSMVTQAHLKNVMTEEAELLWEKAKANGADFGSKTCKLFLDHYMGTWDMKSALNWVENVTELPKRAVKLDQEKIHKFTKYFEEHRDAEGDDRVVEVLKVMVNEGFEPTVGKMSSELEIYTCNTLACGLCRVNRMDEAKNLLHIMVEKNAESNHVSYTTLINKSDRNKYISVGKKRETPGMLKLFTTPRRHFSSLSDDSYLSLTPLPQRDILSVPKMCIASKTKPFKVDVGKLPEFLDELRADTEACLKDLSVDNLQRIYYTKIRPGLVLRCLLSPYPLDDERATRLHQSYRSIISHFPKYMTALDLMFDLVTMIEDHWGPFLDYMSEQRILVIEDWERFLGTASGSTLYDHGVQCASEDGDDTLFYKGESDGSLNGEKGKICIIIWLGNQVHLCQVYYDVPCRDSNSVQAEALAMYLLLKRQRSWFAFAQAAGLH